MTSWRRSRLSESLCEPPILEWLAFAKRILRSFLIPMAHTAMMAEISAHRAFIDDYRRVIDVPATNRVGQSLHLTLFTLKAEPLDESPHQLATACNASLCQFAPSYTNLPYSPLATSWLILLLVLCPPDVESKCKVCAPALW